ncbi:uncharacterized protein LOC141648857 [Silene latifolia]|uniref:uncharacterized protein LOC141648857 n=1 Tax=Silene latifolia TaxID=37657 RepID=UPI003D788D76
MAAPPSSGDSSRFSDGSFSESEDIYMTINTDHGPEFYGVEPPRAVLTKQVSQNERQISVDPISLQGSTNIRQASFRLVSPPAVTPNNGSSHSPSVPSPPAKLKFTSPSLSSSASSSPQSTRFLKRIWKSQTDHNKPNSRSQLSRVQSTMDDTHLAMVETDQRRSRSLGEGRISSLHTDDFDLWLEKPNINKNPRGGRAHSKPPLGPRPPSSEDRFNPMKKSMKSNKSRDLDYPDDGFKCGKLCLFLPRGKGKPVRSMSELSNQVSIQSDAPVISRTVSLQRFECGSFSSSLHEDAEGDSANLFFDLPMEMLRCSVSDMQSPVTAAFVFDNENDNNEDQDMNVDDLDAFLKAQS